MHQSRPFLIWVFAAGSAASLLIGAAVAIASSPASLTGSVRVSSQARPVTFVTPSPSPLPKRVAPSLPGLPGDHAVIALAGSQIVVVGDGGQFSSTDAGHTFKRQTLPDGSAGLLVDGGDSRHRVLGGRQLMTSSDGGASWKPTDGSPPVPAPYTPLLVNPSRLGDWYAYAAGRLYHTVDDGGIWITVRGLPQIVSPLAAYYADDGAFAVAIGNRVFLVDGAARQVNELASLPSGAVATRIATVGTGTPPALVVNTATGDDLQLKPDGWVPVANAPGGPAFGLPVGRGWVVNGGDKIGQPAAMLATLDSGATWVAASGLPIDESVDSVAGVTPSGQTAYAYLAGGDIYRSIDGGLHWELVSGGLRADASVT